jgi:hypothetical protein
MFEKGDAGDWRWLLWFLWGKRVLSGKEVA